MLRLQRILADNTDFLQRGFLEATKRRSQSFHSRFMLHLLVRGFPAAATKSASTIHPPPL